MDIIKGIADKRLKSRHEEDFVDRTNYIILNWKMALFRSTASPQSLAKLLFHAKCFSLLDLALKALFFLYFPAAITFLACLLLCIPSVLALSGVRQAQQNQHGNGGKKMKQRILPAIAHHCIVYIIPLALLLVCLLPSLFYGAIHDGNPPSNTNSPNSACTTTFAHNDGVYNSDKYPKASLKRECHFTVDYNPFCYKGCPEAAQPKCPDGLGIFTLGSEANSIYLGIDRSSCSYAPALNDYQKMLTLELASAVIFAFFAFYFVQMVKLFRFEFAKCAAGMGPKTKMADLLVVGDEGGCQNGQGPLSE